ncbi:MAG: RAMP superfamily CRISPR-associated protein [Candidatus Hodarchaeales archaeon]
MIEINFSILTLEKLHVGATTTSYGVSSVNMTFKSHGKPVIPGSTIKGALKFNYSRLVKCYKDIKPQEEVRRVEEVFGKSNIPSSVLIKNAVIQEAYDFDERLLTDIRPRIAINRARRTTEKGALFNYEEIAPNLLFKSTIIIKGLNSSSIELLLLCLKELELSGIGKNSGLVKVVEISSNNKEVNALIKQIFRLEVE